VPAARPEPEQLETREQARRRTSDRVAANRAHLEVPSTVMRRGDAPALRHLGDAAAQRLKVGRPAMSAPSNTMRPAGGRD